MIALLERRAAAPTTGRPALPRVDLLPPEIGERQHLRRVQGGIGLGVLAALGLTALLHVGASSSVTEAQDSVDAASAQHTQLQRRVAGFRDVTAVYARTEAAEAMLVEAMGAEVRWSRLLDDLSHEVPDRVFLTDLAYVQTGSARAGSEQAGSVGTGGTQTPGAGASIGSVTVAGTAFSHRDVAVWLEAFGAQEGHAGATLQSATERRLGGRTVVDFTSSVSLTAEALSDRYTRAGG